MAINPKQYLDFGLKFHGHKCPAMPLGLKMASIAMNALNVSHAHAGELFAIAELGEHHCATCIIDGVQVLTGCTYGKGNITRSMKGKFGLILINQKTNRGVKVTPIGSWLMKAFQSPFMEERAKGNPPQNIAAEIVDPLIEKVLEMPADQQFTVSLIENIKVEIPAHKWEKRQCEKCGELTVAEYAYVINNQFLCADCADMKIGHLGTPRGVKILNGGK